MNHSLFYDRAQKDFIRFLEYNEKNLIFLSQDVAFAASGHNGPHFALESPVRNSCHWLSAYAIGHSIAPGKGYDIVARSIYNWLVEDCPFYSQNAYVLRQKGGQDWCNGVIGNAWIIEALCRAERYLHISDAKVLAKNIYSNHLFNGKMSVWHRFDPHNDKYAVDLTLDHQAWFAAAAADLGVVDEVGQFLSACVAGSFKVRGNGRINHLFHTSKNMKALFLRALYILRYIKDRNSIDELEIGYHHYTLYPYARLAKYFPDHDFFQSADFLRALQYTNCDWSEKLLNNKFSYVYNAPGFEVPLLLMQFNKLITLDWGEVEKIYELQMQKTSDSNRAFYGKGCPDPLTLTSRIYELGLFLESVNDK